MTVLYLVFMLALLQGIVALVDGVRSIRHIRTYRPRSQWTPEVVVFCPCKGLDPGFEKNVASLLAQDYPRLRVVFIVESQADSAYPVLRSLAASVEVAGEAVDRGQKVHNLIYAVENASDGADVFVFCDADARFPKDWVRNLVAPLETPGVAVATGYRWYAAETGSAASLARSIWNASSVTMLGAHGRNFAWGGSMALRREVFKSIGVREAWEGALSDDYAVTRCARRAGMRIVFVPACLAPSYGDCSWAELVEFTTRQMIITRVYDPAMWGMAFVTQALFNVAFWGSLVVAWPVCVALYILSAVKSFMRYEAVRTVLPDGALSKHRGSYILFAPLIGLLFGYNMVRSVLTRNILWRQKHYRLISPDRTVLHRGGGESSIR